MANGLNEYPDQAKKREEPEPGNQGTRESGESRESGMNAESMHFITHHQKSTIARNLY